MFFNEADKLLDQEYIPLETGYYRLSNGQIHVAVLNRMSGCKGKMLDWWLGWLPKIYAKKNSRGKFRRNENRCK